MSCKGSRVERNGEQIGIPNNNFQKSAMEKKTKTRLENEIEAKWKQLLNQLLPNAENYEQVPFLLEFEEQNEDLDSGFEEILSFMFLPSLYGKVLKYHQVLKNLILEKYRVPLWIKVSLRFEKQVILQMSKRYRSEEIIQKYHFDNELQPFVLVESSKDVTVQTLERFFSRRSLFDYELAFLKSQQLNLHKIGELLSKNFEKTRFYPNKFVKFSPIQASYKGVVLEKKYDSTYCIHEQIQTEDSQLKMLPDRDFETQQDAIKEYLNYFPEIFELGILEDSATSIPNED